MAVLGRTRIGSAGRLDLPDYLSIESFVAGDFKFLIQSFIGQNTPYILKGLDVIQPQDAIGSQTISVRTAEAVVYYPSSNAGSFFYGLQEGQPEADPLVPELRTNATNFVYAVFDTFDTALDSRAFWDPDLDGGAGGEFSQDVNTESVLKISVDVSTSSFPEGAIPICRVVMGASSIESIQDCRNLLFRLGTGGAAPNPLNNFNFRNDPSSAFSRNEPSTIISLAVNANPFQGGDKNIFTMKEWMDVVMTRIKELGGTFFWYQGGSGNGAKDPNVIDLFLDSQGSTIVSKGEFIHDENLPGRAIWTEDVIYTSLIDPRNIIIRASTIDINTDQHVAFIELQRDREINDVSGGAQWQNGQSFVNGPIGTFANLQKGDWVKKGIDTSSEYRRVEEFYANTELTGGTTTPALAQSIRLSATYTGTTSTDITVFTKGEYLDTDITVAARDSSTIASASGDMFWLAYRSDTALGLQGITPTQLSIDILDADDQRARCESVAHGLADGDRITIVGGAYDGTYKVEVETDDVFYIETTATGNDLARAGFYAIVETRARSTTWSFNLETAEHGFQTDQTIFINDTATAYDDSYQINVRSATTFQIPISSLIADPGIINGEIVRLVRLNVRTEFGTVKVVQGETTNIGDMDSANLLSFVGMSSLAQKKPVYSVPNSYNAINGYHNYNSSADDDLTVRTSKLTSMMADRIQDRGMFIRGRVGLKNTPNGADQDITATGNVTIHKPARPSQQIDLTCSLPANSVAVAVIDRDGAANISLSIESVASSFLLEENKIIVFYRFNDTTVYDWHGNAIRSNGTLNTDFPEDSQNKNITVYNPGNVKLNLSSDLLTLDLTRLAEETQITTVDAASIQQSSYFTFFSANDINEYYVWFDIDAGGVDPALAGKIGIQIPITSGDLAADIADDIVMAINLAASIDVTASNVGALITLTNNQTGPSTSVTNGSPSTGFNFFTLCKGSAPDIHVVIFGSTNDNIINVNQINSLSNLIIADRQCIWVRVNRFAQKIFTVVETSDVPDTDVDGALYVTDFDAVPIDQDVFVLWSRINDTVVESHRAKTSDGNVYYEYLDIVAGIPINNYQIQGPLSANTILSIPPDNRDDGNAQEYIVGSGQLEVYLNGQLLRLGVDYDEYGITDCLSNRIEVLREIEVNWALGFRIDAHGAVFFAADGGGGGGSLQFAYEAGRFINVNVGQPIVVTGASGKLLSIQGDVDITGVIDPKGITFTEELTDPLQSEDIGLWVNTSKQMILKRSTLPALNFNTDLLLRDGSASMLGDLDANNNRIVNLENPINPNDAATKAYIDSPLNKNALYSTYANNTGSTLSAGSVVIISSIGENQIELANATNINTSNALIGVIINNIADSESGSVQVAGKAAVLGGPFTVGEPVYVSTSNGIGSSNAPSNPGEVVFILGIAASATHVEINPNFITINSNIYEEKIDIISGTPFNNYELTGPVIVGTSISLPPDSRDNSSSKSYVVGSGDLEVYLNGQRLIQGSGNYIENGAVGNLSNDITIGRILEIEDELAFRINLNTVNFTVGSGTGEVNTASNTGAGAGVFKQKVGQNLEFKSIVAGTGISIVPALNQLTISATALLNVVSVNANHVASLNEDVILVNATTGPISILLPAAATANGKRFDIKKIDSSSNIVTISPNGVEQIDDQSSFTTNTQFESFTIVCDGTQWWAI